MKHFQNSSFTIDEVEKFLGYSLKKVGVGQYRGLCPYCHQEGGDTHEDNLNFSERKGFFCGVHPNNEHGKRLAQEIVHARKQDFINYKKLSEIKYDKQSIEQYSNNLFKNKNMLNLVKDVTGLSEDVIKECKIGFIESNKIFSLPMFALDNSITGLEFRVPENHKGKFKFLAKTKGYASDVNKCLSKINNPDKPTKAFICAGYKDGYAVYQYLKDIGKENEYQILTNTNGEPNTARALEPHLDYLEKFEKVIICLDNDSVGKKATHKVEQSIPITFYNLNLAKLNGIATYINDFNDLYKYIKSHNIKGNIIESNAKFSIQSVLKIYLKFTDLNLDTPKTVAIEDEHAKLLNYIENGIYRFNNNYYEIKYNAKKQTLTYTRKSNFSINILRTVVFNTLNFENIQEHKLEIVTNIANKVSMPKILSQKELLDVNNLHEILKESGIHIHTLKDAQFKNIILNELKNTNEELNIYKNPSLINHNKKNYWLYKNAIVNLETGNILKPTDKDKNIIVVDSKNTISLDVDRGMHAPKLYIPEITYNEFVEQNKDIELIQEFAPTSKTIPSLIAKTLFVNTLRTYGNKVEAFLALGTALMSPFVDIIYDKTMGFPINFMYGEAASGKSNLLQTIAYIFGFDTRFLSSGNDTAMNLLHNMEYYKNIPVLYAEIEGYMRKNFETTVKAVYDRNSRKRMKAYGQAQDVRAVNATLNFASNDRAHRNPQTATRLVYTEFYKDNFNPKEASKINFIRENYLSCILLEVLKAFQNKEEMFKAIDSKITVIQKLNSNLDLRCINNLAIAMLGMDYLYQIAGFDNEYSKSNEMLTLNQNLENYVKSHQDMIHTEDCFEKFMQIFYMLAKNRTIKHGVDYVLKPADRTICIHLKGVYTQFKKQYRQSEDSGVLIPDIRDIQHQAKNKGFKIGHSTNFGETSKRAIVIDVSDDEFLTDVYYELERMEESEGSQDLI